jgi:hypothetical protein
MDLLDQPARADEPLTHAKTGDIQARVLAAFCAAPVSTI